MSSTGQLNLLTPGSSGSPMLQGGPTTTDAATGYSYAPAVTQLADKAGANVAKVDATGLLEVATGGTSTTPIAAAAAAAAIKASAGRLHTILVTTAGTAALSFYDNASAASGTIVGFIPANQAAGSVYTLNMPCANGIWCASGANTPAVTVAWS